jgi:hypothetical protein
MVMHTHLGESERSAESGLGETSVNLVPEVENQSQNKEHYQRPDLQHP